MLATSANDHPWLWEHHLRKVCFAYNTSVHSTTGFTPFYLLFGRQAVLPVHLMFSPFRRNVTLSEYAAHLKYSLEDAYERVRKLHHPWTGLFRVVKRLSDVNYRIQHVQHPRKRMVVHFDRLKPCHLPTVTEGGEVQLLLLMWLNTPSLLPYPHQEPPWTLFNLRPWT